MMNYFSNRKKWMAYLILLTFVFTCIVPTNIVGGNSEAWAATETTEEANQRAEQILKDGDSKSDDYVTVSKVLTPTGHENYFDITLTVETETNLRTEMQKAQEMAVVIVMDISNTMKEEMKDNKTTRYESAMAAAKFFIDSLTEKNDGVNRKVGFVAFNTSAHEIAELQDCKTEGLYDTISTGTGNIINASGYANSRTRYTNIEAGLAMANNMLKDAQEPNKYVIFLSDGFPTTYSTTQGGTIGYEPYTSSATDINAPGVFYDAVVEYFCNSGTSYSDIGASRAQNMAAVLKNDGVTIYSVGVALGEQTVAGYYERNDGTTIAKGSGHGFSVVDTRTSDYIIGHNANDYKIWLKDSIGSGYYYDSTSQDVLVNDFGKILESIELQVQETTSASWVASDVMNALDFKAIDFQGFYNENGNLVNQVNGSWTVGGEDTAAFQNDSINWDLKNSGYTTKSEGDTTKYTYSIKYCVRLADEKDAFIALQEYETNGTTALEYKVTVTKDGQETSWKDGSIDFPIPSVKGYLGELSFTKIDSLTNAPLAGAGFTLTHKDNCSVCTAANNSVTIAPMIATSGADGNVSFTNIPSGHDYVLTESDVPDNYNDNDLPSYDVNVAYGVVTDNIPAVNGDNIITNDRTGTISVEGIKTWVDGSNEDNTRPDSITLNLYRYAVNAENQKVVNDEQITATPEWSKTGDVWTYKFSGLEQYVKHTDGKQYEYTYYIEEEPVSGYESAYGDEKKLDITNTLSQKYITVSGEKIWADGNEKHDSSKPITLGLFRDGRSIATTTTAVNWSYSFGEQPKYALEGADLADGEKADGHVFEYQVREQEIPAGYVPDYNVEVIANGDYYITITNNVRDEKTPLTISGEKIWTDGNDKHNAETEKVKIELFRSDMTDAWKTTETALDWTYSFTDLPKYNERGEWINYTVKEVPVDGYISTVIPTEDGFDIVNTSYVENQGQIAVKKVVTGENTPPEGTEFDFNLKIKAELDLTEFDAVVAKEAKALEEAHNKALEKQATANGNLANAKTAFKTSAFMTTASAYQFILVDGNKAGSFAAVTSPSAMVYNINGERVGVENAEADKTVLNSILEMIEKLADSFSSLYNHASFLHQLAEGPVKSTSPSALAFGITETDNLLKAYAEKRAADRLEAAAQLAMDSYDVTTPTAINIIWNDNGTNKTVTMNPENDLQNDGWYYLNFKLFNDEINSFELKATTGSMITFAITESRPTQDNYTGTEITVKDNVTIMDTISGLFTDVWDLTTESSYGFTFENKYEDKGNDNPPPGKTTISRSVEKVWNDNNNPDRPTSITVQLLRNGEVVETVTLKAENGWSYNWPQLDAGYTWSVKEVNVAEGYTASITRTGNTFVITNSITTTPTDPEETIPDENVPTGSVEPGEPLDELDEPEIPLGDAPATGDANNAAPLMALLLAAIAGLVITRRKFN